MTTDEPTGSRPHHILLNLADGDDPSEQRSQARAGKHFPVWASEHRAG
jgi:hypothetical protein